MPCSSRLERVRKVVSTADLLNIEFHAQCARHGVERPQMKLPGGRVPERGDTRSRGNSSFQNLKPLGVQLCRQDADTGHIAPRTSQADDVSLTDQVVGSGNDRDCRRRLPRRADRQVADRQDGVHRKLHQPSGEGRKAPSLTFSRTPLNSTVAPVYVARIPKSLRKFFAPGIVEGVGRKNAEAPIPPRLLQLCLDGKRSPEKCAGTCDERASIHVNQDFGPAQRRYQPRREAPSAACRSYAAPTSTNSPSELGVGAGSPS